ncbi:MAG: pyridoxal phosphate-dependent decarboxylase family protein, partial [Kiloniellales bacterium]
MTGGEFRALGHDLIDRIADFLETIAERPAAPHLTPQQARARVGQDALPDSGADAGALLERAAALLFDGCRINGHPRSWGYIIGSPAPLGMLADLLASSVNPNLAAWNSAPVPTEIEAQAVRWIAELLGYPGDCGGLLVSGGNMANFVGFLTARRAKAPWDLRREGLAAPGQGRLRLYTSAETHTWVEKAADLFGLGSEAIRWVPADREQRMDAAALVRLVEADKAAGDLPFLLIGTAGTVSTGAVDPLFRLAEIARAHDLWFHVDGAYGAPAVLAPSAPAELAGLRLADSIAIDAHKWLYLPLEAGCALVRDRRALRNTFSYQPPYYHHHVDDREEVLHYFEYGPQNSRCFRALKVWLALQRAGRSAYAEMIAGNIALSERLHRRIAATPELEAATQNLSITTFRFVPQDLDPTAAEAYLNELNGALLTELQRSGEAFLSNAVVDGRFLLRACITNFRSTEADVDALPEIVLR